MNNTATIPDRMASHETQKGGTPPPRVEPHWLSRSAFQMVVLLLLLTEIALFHVVQSGASLWLAVPLVFLISHFMHGGAVGLHEASHGHLRRSRFLNELDGFILGTVGLMSFSLYRAAHQLHHAYLATERDEELWPFTLPTAPRWGRVLAAFLELTVGMFYTPFLFLRTFLRRGSPIRSRKVRNRIWTELALIAGVWITILSLVARWNAWVYFLWMYLAPTFLAANLQSWRKYIEHVGLTGSTINSATRNVIPQKWPGRLLAFTLLHEPYHGVHHMHAGLKHAELPAHSSKLLPATPEERPPFPSYLHALGDLLRCLPDPRVGAQWHRMPPQV